MNNSLYMFLVNYLFQNQNVNMTINTQTVTCNYDPLKGGYWSNNPIVCEPLTCLNPLPSPDPSGAAKNIVYSPNPVTNQQYQTTINFTCPANLTLPTIISSNFSFNYNVASGMIYNVSAFCDIDR